MSAPIVRPTAAEFSGPRERRRVRAHLRRAERSARRASTAHLDPLRRRVRALLLDELAAYRARGLFPRNITVSGFNPVFVDDVGTRCAVAHLLDVAGGMRVALAASAVGRPDVRWFILPRRNR
jgi:hypothetical protein